jgi:serine O-acetyltransferase
MNNSDLPTLQDRLVEMMKRRGTRRLAYKALKLLGVEIPPSVRIGKGFHLAHGAVGLVMGEVTVIGDNVKIFQGVTLGFADQYLRPDQFPADVSDMGRIVVEDDVVIGAGAKVLHKCGQTLVVGKGALIGANAVVLKSVPAGEVWAGIPARKVGVNPNLLPQA